MSFLKKIFVDRLLRIKVSDLKSCGSKGNILSLQKRNALGEIIECLYIGCNWRNDSDKVVVSYVVDGKPTFQTIFLAQVKSNVQANKFYSLFICPVTGNRCFKLYFNDGMFMGRHALTNSKYTIQIHRGDRRTAILQRLARKLKKLQDLGKELENYGARSRIKKMKLISHIQILIKQIA